VTSSAVADNSVRAEVTAPARSLVVVSQNLADGWTARVDGTPAPLVAVDGALMGVFVDAGRHTVTLDYRPKTFLAGGALSGVALLAAGVAVVLPSRRSRRRRGVRSSQ
jgi:uncharacterized membrane protein YfhO